MGRQKDALAAIEDHLMIRNKLVWRVLAECLGMMILALFGCDSVAQIVLSRGTHGGFLTFNLAFGFAVMLGILISGQVSGGHLNLAVTFAMCFLAWEPWIKLPVYALAQTLGAFLRAGIVFGLYYGRCRNCLVFVGGRWMLFVTYCREDEELNNLFKRLMWIKLFFFPLPPQFIGTASLIVCVLAIIDPYNNPVPMGLEAFTVGFVVLVTGTSMGFNSGYAVNPARDFGPCLFTAIAGWGTEVFWTGKQWWWVPVVAPFFGAIVGVMVYQLMTGCHDEPSPPASEQETVKLANVKHKERV
ncbi:AQP3 protein, partial [Rynchops niger]|nr:AQP3 protein [Rynchops niger]